MTMTDSSSNCISPLGRIMEEGVKEIIGQDGMNAVYHLTGRGERESAGEELARMQIALERLYGARGGRGVALRAGRAAFDRILKQYGGEMGVKSLDYRLNPTPRRLRIGLEALATQLTGLCDESIEVLEDEAAWIWRLAECPLCRPGGADEPACSFFVGLLQEFTGWASGGKIYAVSETECRASGNPACVVRIEKRPLE